jgi:hypothetical protein
MRPANSPSTIMPTITRPTISMAMMTSRPSVLDVGEREGDRGRAARTLDDRAPEKPAPREGDLDRLASGGHAGKRQQRIAVAAEPLRVARRAEPAAAEERGAR